MINNRLGVEGMLYKQEEIFLFFENLLLTFPENIRIIAFTTGLSRIHRKERNDEA
jgi:hypothetical protein